ncbi:hypothetical protein ACGFYA_10620 [Streptomyces sp. NPDC048305]|uniref:hypothetical protein n=1 Tax=Streptomyces sp. NPDC048305 TaxID=3365532 RepID=UPI0037224703
MSATTVPSATKSPRLPLLRLALRQYRVVAALVLLLAIRVAAPVVYHFGEWAEAIALRERVGSHAYHFATYVSDAHTLTTRLLDDGSSIAFLPALLSAATVAVLTAREWESRSVDLALTQSVAPTRWFSVRWATVAAVFVVLTTLLVVLFQRSAGYAIRHDLLVHGAEWSTAAFTIGPVTVAYTVLGAAAGAYAGTLLRRTWAALIAAPLLTWLATAVLVRSRLVLLVDFPVFSKVHGFHPGGVLGLTFYDALPQDVYLINSLDSGDYWGYQIASSALALAVAALLGWAALRTLRRRTA